jgi:hypothetical protein
MANLRRTFKQKNITPWQERIAEAVVILMLCVQPLYFNEHRYRGLTGHKYNFFFVCMCIVLCAVVLVLIAKLIGKHKFVSLKNLSTADWAALGFALVTLISALFSPYRNVIDVWNGLPERHDGAITQLFYVAIFLIVAHWYRPRVRDFKFFGISAIAIGLIGVFQFYGMDFFRLWPNEEFLANGQPNQYHVENFYNIHFRSTLGNINMVATYVCVAILLCGFLYVKTEAVSKIWRYVWLAGCTSCFWLMLVGGSESGMVGVLVTMVLAVPFIIQRREHIGRFLILGSSWLGVFTLQKLLFDLRIMEAESAGRIGLYAAITAVPLAGGLALTLLLKRKKEDDNETEKPIKWKIGVAFIVVIIVVGFVSVEILGRHNNLEGFRAGGDAKAEITSEQAFHGFYSMLVTGGGAAEISVETFVKADVEYEIYAMMQLKTPESAEFTMSAQTGFSGDYHIIRTATVTDSDWMWLGGLHTFNEDEIASGLITIYIESDSRDIEFYIDRFYISHNMLDIRFNNIQRWSVYEMREMLHGRAKDTFGSNRIYIWRNALEAFSNHNPVIGSGPSAFWQAFPAQAEARTLHGVVFDKAHNEYLQILVCQGISGLLCYLIFLGYLLVKAIPKAFKNPLLVAVLAGFTGYSVQAFFNISLPIASQMLWVMAGILACYLRLDKME